MEAAFTPGLLARLPRPPRKVALLRASRLGDFICATPAFRALRTALPDAEIIMVTLPILQALVERCPYLDRFAPFPGFPGIAEQFFDARRATAFFQEMQGEEIDLAIQMQGSGVYANPFTLLLGARHTAGFIRPGDTPRCLDAAMPLPEEGHEIERVLALVRFLGAEEQGRDTAYPLCPADHHEAARLLAGAAQPLIGLHPGSWDEQRRWPLSHFVEAGKALQQHYGGTIVLIGGPLEREQLAPVADGLGEGCLNLIGRTSLGSLGAVLCRLAVLITNDSGPAHVAYALGVPTVTVCHGADVDRYSPPQLGPFRLVTPLHGCRDITHVDVERVVDVVDRVLKMNP